MSNYLKRGRRQSTIAKAIKTKKHIKNFYKKLHELDLVAQAMIQSGIPITEDNVETEAAKYTDSKIEKMEKNILLSKITQVYNEIGIKTKDKDEV